LSHHAPGADDYIDHTLRKLGLQSELRQAQRRQRRQLGGLQHHRVPTGERRPDLPAGDVEREVPGHDQPDNPQRLAEGQIDTPARWDGGTARHAGNAARARATASSVSSTPASGSSAIVSSVAGLTTFTATAGDLKPARRAAPARST